MTQNTTDKFFKTPVLGHPAGLFILFFTEMWERFSFYGKRALLVLLLVSASGIGRWDWPSKNAFVLYCTYLVLLYLTLIIVETLADKYMGNRRAIIIGAVITTLGFASLPFGIVSFLKQSNERNPLKYDYKSIILIKKAQVITLPGLF